MVWVADQEGHMVIYLTETKEYVRKVVEVAGAESLLVPRYNETASVFVRLPEQTVFREYMVDSPETEPVVRAGARELPGDTRQVLFCDADTVVAVTERDLVQLSSSGKAAKRAIDIKDSERIIEGVYAPKTQTACALVGPKVKPTSNNVRKVREAWEEMRPVWIDVKPAQP